MLRAGLIYKNMDIKIPSKTSKDKFIYGNLSENQNNKILVIFLSGFSGSKNLPLFKNISQEFLKNGFSTFRFNFCLDEDDSKNKKGDELELKDLTFSVYVSELKNIVDFLSSKYLNIVLVGHSFGAVISILFLSQHQEYLKNISLVLWEPTLLPWKREWMEEDFSLNKQNGFYISKINQEIINQEFYEETININNTANTLGGLDKGICIMAARGSADHDSEEYFSNIKDKKSSKLYIIDNTNHYFDGEKVQLDVFKKTINFIKSK